MTTPKKLLGWKPKGEAEQKAISFLRNELINGYYPIHFNVITGFYETKYEQWLPILKALCDLTESDYPEYKLIDNTIHIHEPQEYDHSLYRELMTSELLKLVEQLNSSPKGPVTIEEVEQIASCFRRIADAPATTLVQSMVRGVAEEGLAYVEKLNNRLICGKGPVTLTDEEIVEKWRSIPCHNQEHEVIELVRWARGEDK